MTALFLAWALGRAWLQTALLQKPVVHDLLHRRTIMRVALQEPFDQGSAVLCGEWSILLWHSAQDPLAAVVLEELSVRQLHFGRLAHERVVGDIGEEEPLAARRLEQHYAQRERVELDD